MVEPEASIDSLITALRRQMIDAFPATFVPDREQLGRDPMDPFVGRYLEEELDRRVDQELARLTYDPSDWVTGERREFVDRAHRNLRTSIATAVSFPASRWEALVARAATATCSFVMKPASTLESEVFQLRADSVSSATARSRVRALAGHPALTERLDVWLVTSEEPIRRHAFATAVTAILDETIAQADDWVRVAEPLFALHQRINGQRVVPSLRLEALYDDLGLSAVSERIADLAKNSEAALWNEGMLVHALTAETGSQQKTVVVESEDAGSSRFEFVDIADEADDEFAGHSHTEPDLFDTQAAQLERTADVAAEYAAGMMSSAVASTPESTQVSDLPPVMPPVMPAPSDTDSESKNPEDEDEPVPLWMKFQSKINAPMSPRPETDTPSVGPPRSKEPLSPSPDIRPAVSSTAEKSNRPLWERYRKPESRAEISTETPAEFHEVETYVLGQLDTSQRQAYIETLFNSRASEYREMIYSLSEIESWSEATGAIADEVFRRNRVNIYSEVAIEFTNAVEKRYKR